MLGRLAPERRHASGRGPGSCIGSTVTPGAPVEEHHPRDVARRRVLAGATTSGQDRATSNGENRPDTTRPPRPSADACELAGPGKHHACRGRPVDQAGQEPLARRPRRLPCSTSAAARTVVRNGPGATARAISSVTTASSRSPPPWPPCSSAMWSPEPSLFAQTLPERRQRSRALRREAARGTSRGQYVSSQRLADCLNISWCSAMAIGNALPHAPKMWIRWSIDQACQQ